MSAEAFCIHVPVSRAADIYGDILGGACRYGAAIAQQSALSPVLVLRLIGGATSYAALKRMASDLVSERKASAIVTAVELWAKTGQTPEELAGQVELIIRG